MRWLIFALVVALAGCTDNPEPLDDEMPEQTVPLPDNVRFEQSGTLEDGTFVAYPFEVDPRARAILAEIRLIPNDVGKITNDVSASLMHNGTFIAAGGSQGTSTSVGNGGSETILYYEAHVTPSTNLTALAGSWEIRFSASGVQLADYEVELNVLYR